MFEEDIVSEVNEILLSDNKMSGIFQNFCEALSQIY